MALGPLPDVANVVRVRWSGLYGVAPWVALFHTHYMTTPPNEAALITYASANATLWSASLQGAFHGSVVLQTIDCWDLSSRTGAVGSASVGVPGNRSGNPLPASIAAVTSWKVNMRYRGGHPRTYWPAGVTSDVAPGGRQWTETARVAFENAMGSLLSGWNSLTLAGQPSYMTLVRYVHTPTPGAPPEYFDPPLDLRIIDESVDARIDTQRRRLGPDIT